MILRPHPQSLKVETEMLDTIHEMLRDYPNVSFDTEMDATASMSRADVMISDKSCVRFDFAFLYEKPVITLDIPVRNPESTRWRTWASSGKTPWPPVWAKWSRPRTSTTSCPWWNAPQDASSAIAAFRAKQHPNLIQIFEVGTASMMAAKGAIRPVYEIMEAAGTPVDTSKLLGSVASYYSSTDGKLIAMPSTPPPPSSTTTRTP